MSRYGCPKLAMGFLYVLRTSEDTKPFVPDDELLIKKSFPTSVWEAYLQRWKVHFFQPSSSFPVVFPGSPDLAGEMLRKAQSWWHWQLRGLPHRV